VTDILITALVYFGVVFAAGFQLGTIRVLLLEPRIRAFVATLREAPFLLGAIVLAARWSPAATGLVAHQRKLVPIGLAALALQLIAEVVRGDARQEHSRDPAALPYAGRPDLCGYARAVCRDALGLCNARVASTAASAPIPQARS
jgi:hypothetical protein